MAAGGEWYERARGRGETPFRGRTPRQNATSHGGGGGTWTGVRKKSGAMRTPRSRRDLGWLVGLRPVARRLHASFSRPPRLVGEDAVTRRRVAHDRHATEPPLKLA